MLTLTTPTDETKTIKGYSIVSVIQVDDEMLEQQRIDIVYRKQFSDDTYSAERYVYRLEGEDLATWMADNKASGSNTAHASNQAFYLDGKDRSYATLMAKLSLSGTIE